MAEILGSITPVLTLLVYFLVVSSSTSENVLENETSCTTKIDDGAGIGSLKQTVNKAKNYCSFLGIPYAQPPIEDLRFEVSLFY